MQSLQSKTSREDCKRHMDNIGERVPATCMFNHVPLCKHCDDFLHTDFDFESDRKIYDPAPPSHPYTEIDFKGHRTNSDHYDVEYKMRNEFCGPECNYGSCIDGEMMCIEDACEVWDYPEYTLSFEKYEEMYPTRYQKTR